MELIDTHAHLDESAFEHDIETVVDNAASEGVVAVLTIGTTLDSSRRALELARRFPLVHAAVGIQPNYAAEAGPDDWAEIETLAADPRVLAVGETGLDKYWDYAPLDLQRDYFDRHLALSRRLGKPFIVHCREAEAEVVEQLQRDAEQGPLLGVMHSFCGDAVTLEACLELGMYISFAGMLTFKNNQALRDVAALVPRDRLLVETDAPYLSPHPLRGKRNEPARVRLTCECLAGVHGISLEEMAEITTANARRLFGF